MSHKWLRYISKCGNVRTWSGSGFFTKAVLSSCLSVYFNKHWSYLRRAPFAIKRFFGNRHITAKSRSEWSSWSPHWRKSIWCHLKNNIDEPFHCFRFWLDLQLYLGSTSRAFKVWCRRAQTILCKMSFSVCDQTFLSNRTKKADLIMKHLIPRHLLFTL